MKTTDADRLRSKLAELGLSQRAAARELDIDERTMRRYCSGANVPRTVFLALEALEIGEEKKMTYSTITDAYTVLDNSGVSEWLDNEVQRRAVAERMRNEEESPEEAVANVLDVDEADRRALGLSSAPDK